MRLSRIGGRGEGEGCGGCDGDSETRKVENGGERIRVDWGTDAGVE